MQIVARNCTSLPQVVILIDQSLHRFQPIKIQTHMSTWYTNSQSETRVSLYSYQVSVFITQGITSPVEISNRAI